MMRQPKRVNLYDRFFKSLMDFIEALCETYPKCHHLSGLKMKLSLSMGQKATRDIIWNNWNRFVSKYSTLISINDESLIPILANESLFKSSDLNGKWKLATPEIQSAIWAHINKLAECSAVYGSCKKIPPDSMAKQMNK